MNSQKYFSSTLWINKNTREILDPILYTQFNSAVVGNYITIDKITYQVKEVKSEIMC